MRKATWAVMAALALGAAFGRPALADNAGSQGAQIAPGGGHITTPLNAQNGSAESGTAVLSAVNANETMVTISLANGTSEPQPAHVHRGSCANLDPKPLYPLNNVVNGQSETTIPVSLAELTKGGYAINVHKSAAEVAVYVSCGDTFVETAGGVNPGMPTTGAGGTAEIAATLALLALACLGAGARLARVRA
jgi:hypothetical protein